MALFQGRPPEMQICASPSASPSDLLDDIRKFSYGRSREQIDQISNFLVMIQLIQVMNSSGMEEGEPLGQNWQNDPRLNNIDPSKLALLQNLAGQSGGRSPSDMLPFLMSAAAQGGQNGLNFSPDEISTILSVLKTGKSPAKLQNSIRSSGLCV